MKVKLLLTVFIFSFFAYVFSFQLPMVKRAVDARQLPVTYFLLQGKVQYLGGKRLMPAVSVRVTAQDVKDKYSTFTTQTDQKGFYKVALPKYRTFEVSPKDNLGTIFNPTSYIAIMLKDLRNYNFIGYLRP